MQLAIIFSFVLFCSCRIRLQPPRIRSLTRWDLCHTDGVRERQTFLSSPGETAVKTSVICWARSHFLLFWYHLHLQSSAKISHYILQCPNLTNENRLLRPANQLLKIAQKLKIALNDLFEAKFVKV